MGQEHSRFLLDTGVGINVVSPGLAERLALPLVGERFVGQRMSGQQVEAELVYLPPIHVGELVIRDQVGGVVDLGPESGEDGFSGILGLTPFDGIPLTIDPSTSALSFGDPGPADFVVPLDVRRDGPATTPFADLVLPDGQTICVEVDTGSENLILDHGYWARGEVSVMGMPETSTGTDQTGFEWTRVQGQLRGRVHFATAPESAQETPEVLFQDIIHDGLVGTEFLDRFRYTVDIGRERLQLTSLNPHN